MLPKEVFMEQKKDICPYCGGTKTVVGKQYSQAAVFRLNAKFMHGGTPLLHIICRDCGTVIRSCVESPSNLT